MVIDKLGALNNITSVYSNQIRKESGTDAAQRRSDTVEVTQASRLNQFREAVKKAVQESDGDVRMDKVAAAKAKLEDGSLINDAVIDEIASRIVDSMGLR